MSVFRFKQFEVAQDQCAMKVGTDSTLLGAWAICENAEHILDIGAGSAVITLMLAQRSPHATLLGIEIESNAYQQALDNVQKSPWAARIQMLHIPIQEYQNSQIFDCIVSNPPFYPAESFVSSPDAQRRLARSTHELPYSDLLAAVQRLLKPETGLFSLILPIETGGLFVELAAQFGLFLQKRTLVIPRAGKAPNRVLMSFSSRVGTTEEAELIIRNAGKEYHDYSEEFTKLLKDFLIIF